MFWVAASLVCVPAMCWWYGYKTGYGIAKREILRVVMRDLTEMRSQQ